MELAQKFEIHYYLSDNSHSMNSLVKNKCETEFLAVANEIANILGVELVWESQALEEGGIREVWSAIGTNNAQIALVVSILAFIWSMVPQEDQELLELQKTEARLSIEQKKLEIQRLKQEIENKPPTPDAIKSAVHITIDSYKVVTRRSNFYKSISECPKVYQIGFSTRTIENKSLEKENVVISREFRQFFLKSNELEPQKIASARIEIVSPVLKEGKSKWKGIYEGESISFAMNDNDFKNDVLSQKISFKNGSEIICALVIHKKIDELGDIVTSGYSVDIVLESIESGLPKETTQGKKFRHTQKQLESQTDLFDDLNA